MRLPGWIACSGSHLASKPFYYKDATSKPDSSKEALNSKIHFVMFQIPNPYSIEKENEVPRLEIIKVEVNILFSTCKSKAIICKFNNFWPRTKELEQWIHANWTTNCDYYLCSKNFFIVQFFSQADYKHVFEEGPRFRGRGGCFISPWFPYFDPTTMTITKNSNLGLALEFAPSIMASTNVRRHWKHLV